MEINNKFRFRFFLFGKREIGQVSDIITIFFVFVMVSAQTDLKAQATYTSNNYASNGDTVYLTKASGNGFNFDTTGANFTWNYSTLSGNSQTTLVFRAPNQTGFTPIQWLYINNANNVNQSSTDGQTVAIGNLQKTDPNDYFLKNTGAIAQKASSFKVVINNSALSIKNVYDNPDTIFKFPINYANVDSCTSTFTTSIPNLYYNHTQIKRTNTVEGYGSVTTPYGTYSNALKVKTDLVRNDSIILNDTLTIVVANISRELKWIDPAEGYPVLIAKQTLVNNSYITQSVEYLDAQQFFTPNALFAYLPIYPSVGDTVIFQNLSTNSLIYEWDFDDPSSGASNTSNLQNPNHIFNSAGTYQVQLIAHNGPLADTASLPVNVGVLTDNSFELVPLPLAIYPNPSNGNLYISLPDIEKNSILSIYDLKGDIVFSEILITGNTTKQLDISGFANGLYQISLQTGNSSSIQPILIRH